MTISAFPTPTPSRSQSQTVFDAAVEAFLTHLPTFVSEANATAVAMNLNSTTDTSASSVAIGTGAKTFTVSSGKSFLGGMYVVIADAAAPSTNLMVASVTSYSGTTLVVNVEYVRGSGTKTSWIISQSAPAANIAEQIHGATEKTTPVDADELGIWDSVSGLLRKVTRANWFMNIVTLHVTTKALFGSSTQRTDFIDGTRTNAVQVEAAGAAAAAVDAASSALILNSSTTSAGPRRRFARSKGNSVGSVAAVTTGDDCGAEVFYGADGTYMQSCAQAGAEVDAAVSAGIVPGRYVVKTANASGTMTEAVRYDSSQRQIRSAAVAPAVTFANPATGSTVTLTNATEHWQKTGTATIAALTVNLPANPANGQIVSFGSAAIITTLTVGSAGADTIRNAPTTAAADSCFEWIYNLSATTWFRRK